MLSERTSKKNNELQRIHDQADQLMVHLNKDQQKLLRSRIKYPEFEKLDLGNELDNEKDKVKSMYHKLRQTINSQQENAQNKKL